MPPCLRKKTSLKGWQDYRQAVSEAQPLPQGIMTKARMGGRTLSNKAFICDSVFQSDTKKALPQKSDSANEVSVFIR
jgi:hypothetical protein